MNNKWDGLYYIAPNGKRKLKRYVVMVCIICTLLMAGIVFTFIQRSQVKAKMTHVDLMEGTPTSSPSSTLETCPSDPGRWVLVDLGNTGSKLKRIEPACVYDGLGKTIAWMLAISEGYSRADATQSLGFAEPPVQTSMSTLKVIDPVSGNQLTASLSTIPLEAEFEAWFIDKNSQPALAYFQQGCFRGINMVGNEVRIWNQGYPIICYVAEDNAAAYSITKLDTNLYSGPMTMNLRSWLYFGYNSKAKRWDYLGTDTVLYLSLDPTTMSKDHESYSELFGGIVWDSEWLSNSYGLEIKQLPDNWQNANDKIELQAILDAIDSSKKP